MAIAFDEQFYLSQNPDVAAAVSRGIFTSGAQHFEQFGRFEARDPSAFFDTSFYLSQYPDVAAAGVNPFDHFLTFGAAEGRFTNEVALNLIDSDSNGVANEFDSAAYLAANPDVAAAVTAGVFTSAYQHFAQFGQFEARQGVQTTSGVVIDGNLPTNGTPVFTTGADTLTGTSSNDVFSATAANFGTGDVVNGGAGTDTLLIRASAAGSNTGTALRSVETIVVSNTASSGTTYAFDAALAQNASSFAARGQVAGNTTTFTNVAAASTLALDNVDGTVNFNVSGTRTGTADAVTVNVSNGSGTATTAATIGFVGTDGSTADTTFETLNLNTSGDASFVALAAGNTSFTTLNVAGSGNLTIADSATLANLTTINASTLTGAFDIDLTSNAAAVAFTGGAGNDTVSFGTANLTSADTLIGGAGTDTVAIAGQSLTTGETLTALNTKVSGFEVLEFTGTTGATITGGTGTGAFTNTEITKILFNTTNADTINNAGSARTYAFGGDNGGAATLNLGNGVTSVNVSLEGNDTASTGGADVNGLSVVNNAAAPAGQSVTINLSSTGALDLANSIGTINAALGSTVNVTGDHDLTISGLTNAGVINASSFTGDLTATGAATGNNVLLSGLGNDNLTGGAGLDNLNGGAGNDLLFGRGGADTIVGGEGNDIIQGDGVGVAATVDRAEIADVDFRNVAAGETVIIDGVTFTAGGSGATAQQVASSFATGTAAGGTLSGSFSNYTAAATGTTDVVRFTANTAGNVTDLTATGTGTIDGVTVNQGSSAAPATISLGGDTAGADILTGGAGNDQFRFASGSTTATVIDTITDLNLGTNVVGGQVDTLVFQNAGATVSIVSLTAAQQTAVTGAADLTTALGLVAAATASDGATSLFTYGSDTYVFHDADGNGAYNAAADFVVKVTGVTGTLDSSDIAVI